VAAQPGEEPGRARVADDHAPRILPRMRSPGARVGEERPEAGM
jgi:hypothetical protein